MKIAGFQKLSLLEYPDKICAIIFTQGCNFRCAYCHNPELVEVQDFEPLHLITEEEVFGYLVLKKKMLDGVCITGGEPTLQADLIDFIIKIKKIGYLVKLDTNGSNPVMLAKLFKKKLLDYVAMDLKSSWTRYSDIKIFGNYKINKIGKIVSVCQQSFKLIQNSGVDHEFRTTIYPQKHVEGDFFEMAGYLKNGEKYCLQNIRYIKNLDKNLDQSKKINAGLLLNKLKQKFPNLNIELR